jgi:hypothetical protein
MHTIDSFRISEPFHAELAQGAAARVSATISQQDARRPKILIRFKHALDLHLKKKLGGAKRAGLVYHLV